MKKFIFILCITAFNLYAMPTWYLNRDFKQPEQSEVIGYGEDKNLQNAILNAKEDISMQLNTKVKSQLIQNYYRFDKRESSSATQTQSIETNEILKDTIVIKQEKIDDIWYVVVSYDNIPFIMKFIKKLPNNLKDEKQNRYLANTLLLKELNALVGAKINAKLYYYEDNFHIGYKNHFQDIDIKVPELFINLNTNPHNSLNIDKKSSFENVILKFEVVNFEMKSSNKKFVSLFAISPEGRVLILEDNLMANTKTSGYKFKNLKQNEERDTMFVAVFSDTKLDNSYFRNMTGNESDASYLQDNIKFHKFIEFIDDTSIDFISKKITIKER